MKLILVVCVFFVSISSFAQQISVNKDYEITQIRLLDSLPILDFNILYPDNPAISYGYFIYEPIQKKYSFISKSSIFFSFSPAYKNSAILFLNGDTTKKAVFAFYFTDSTLNKITDVPINFYRIFALSDTSFLAFALSDEKQTLIYFFDKNKQEVIYSATQFISTLFSFSENSFLFAQFNKILFFDNQNIKTIYINELPITGIAVSENGEIYFSDVSGIYLIKDKKTIIKIVENIYGELFYQNKKLFILSQEQNKIFVIKKKD